MVRLKDYFADGMIQIAIMLSLFRADIYPISGDYWAANIEPVALGSSAAYIRTGINIHGISSLRYPKTLDILYDEEILHHVHSLGRYQTYDGFQQSIQTFLVSGPESHLPIEHGVEAASLNVLESHTLQNNEGNEGNSDSQQILSAALMESNRLPDYFESDLTKEDMDLIDILWRQDIDLGIGRDVFEASLRELQEKEYNLKIKDASEEVNSQNLIESEKHNAQSSNNGNFTIDNETGEVVFWSTPSTAGVVDSSLGADTATCSCLDKNSSRVCHQENISNEHLENVSELENLLASISTSGDSDQFTSAKQGEEVQRSNSLEEALEDAFGFMLSDQSNATQYYDNNSLSQPVLPMENLFLPADHYQLFPSQGLPQQSVLTRFDTSDLSDVLLQNVSIAPTYCNQLRNNSLMAMGGSSVVSSPSFSISLGNSTYDARLSPVFNLNLTAAGETNYLSNFGNSLNSTVDMTALGAVGGSNGSFWSKPLIDTNKAFDELVLAPYASNDSFIQQLLERDLEDISFDDNFDDVITYDKPMRDHWSTDSAVSSMHSPTNQQENDGFPPMDGVDEEEVQTEKDKYANKYSDIAYYHSSAKSLGASASYESNNSCAASNSSYPEQPREASRVKDVYHNHSYNLQPGQLSREEKELEVRRIKEEKSTRCKDGKRAKELKLPYDIEDIIYSSVDRFTEMISGRTLTEQQLQLMRDIRRRGKNKEAAQSCRKRKMEVIQSLEDELASLRADRDQLRKEKLSLNSSCLNVKDKLARLQADLLQTLRDANGNPCNSNEYSLQRTAEGDVILVPKDNRGLYQATTANHPDKNTRKKKPKRKD